ncbi:MAG TPA: lipopolysaccharide kinase InaA family protein, partial [Planctomycetota bacterium]|nr:lipopolysaccharide kinase InaA family protein [Planctomycetota bacterium]
ATPLRDLLAAWQPRSPAPRERRAVITAVADAVARLHVRGVDHDDLSTKNFLVRHGPPVECFVIDLEAVRSLDRTLPRERILRALMQLDDCPRGVSRCDRMRFLAAYERATHSRFTRSDLAEVRRMLRDRFARSGRDFAREGPR